MELFFEKYQGTGNDFIMIDQRATKYIDHDDQQFIAHLCDRRFGIGADGLILLENSIHNDFKMVYFNADGRQSTMCGNGGRCIVKFAHHLNIFNTEAVFDAIDGEHKALINEDKTISLQMIDVNDVQILDPKTYELNTGSPHYVAFCDQMPENIKSAGSTIRYSPKYNQQGINVNFVKNIPDGLEISTYERGVEDETFSCGTGVTAAALANAIRSNIYGRIEYPLKTKGGQLKVSFFRNQDSSFTDVWLIGPAERTFGGRIDR